MMASFCNTTWPDTSSSTTGCRRLRQKNYRDAVAYWEKVVQTALADSEFTQSLKVSLDEARALADGRTPPTALPNIMPAAPAMPAASAGASAVNGGQVSGQVKVAPEVAAKVAPGDTLFVFARAENGPRMSLAILSLEASELPVRFSLDDSNAMAPGMKLSAFPSVMVVARISKSGNASAQRGDLEGSVGPVKPGMQNIVIRIDKVIA